ncbi:MAG: hypothetical protein OXI33_10615 [Chloroflexota bacterium]|nr:hypothetical protein [Chloroflexota bacterium]
MPDSTLARLDNPKLWVLYVEEVQDSECSATIRLKNFHRARPHLTTERRVYKVEAPGVLDGKGKRDRSIYDARHERGQRR